MFVLPMAHSHTSNAARFTCFMRKLLSSRSAPVHRGQGSQYGPIKGPVFGLLYYGTRHPFRAALGPKALPSLGTPCASRGTAHSPCEQNHSQTSTASLTRSQARSLDTKCTARPSQEQQHCDSLALVRRQEGQQARWRPRTG